MKFCLIHEREQIQKGFDSSTLDPGGGTLECNLTGRCPFFKDLHNPFRKKFAF